jgi:hypothetical protein
MQKPMLLIGLVYFSLVCAIQVPHATAQMPERDLLPQLPPSVLLALPEMTQGMEEWKRGDPEIALPRFQDVVRRNPDLPPGQIVLYEFLPSEGRR